MRLRYGGNFGHLAASRASRALPLDELTLG